MCPRIQETSGRETHPAAEEGQESQGFPILDEFLIYMEAILGRRPLTIREYRYDLILFFRYWLRSRGRVPKTLPFSEISITAIGTEELKDVSLNDCYAFLAWLNRERRAGAANRARKVAALRAFFKYLSQKKKLLKQNPCQDLESPKQAKRLPRYLNLEESQRLLESCAETESPFSSRDYCILTFFLNCGLRLSELAQIRLDEIRENRLRVVGKGDKERLIYLNAACMAALAAYLPERPKHLSAEAAPYLFISRQGNPMANASIQRMIKRQLLRAGLDTRRYSTHKLRHTAATLMYQYGQVDIRMLQQILGHQSVATTEIYTHSAEAQLQDALSRNPLVSERRKHEPEGSVSADSADSGQSGAKKPPQTTQTSASERRPSE